VPSSLDRERKLARAKLERQQARRAQKIRVQRQRQAQIGAAVAILLVLAGIGLATHWYGLSSSTKATAAECTWTPASAASNKNLKDAGLPPTTGIPMSGAEPMTITTNQGDIGATLDVTQAPCTSASFSYLASKHFFDNTKCHRLTTSGIFVLQCGDPSGTGTGGPTYTIQDENIPVVSDAGASGASAPSTVVYKAGTIAVANTGSPNSGSSQFFLVYKDTTLPDSYSVFGTIDTAGIDVIKKIAAGGVATGGTSATDGPPKLATTIQTLTIGKDIPSTPSPVAAPASSAPAPSPSVNTSASSLSSSS
jgi:peptidyl-prolyl cis-trans isomerase B (cyclophilin B)